MKIKCQIILYERLAAYAGIVVFSFQIMSYAANGIKIETQKFIKALTSALRYRNKQAMEYEFRRAVEQELVNRFGINK